MSTFTTQINKFWIVTLLIFTASLSASAQNNKIQIRNQTDNTPVTEASYIYDQQTGTSDGQGFIELTFVEGASLKISHVTFNNRTFKPDEIKTLMKEGTIYMTEYSQSLQPVTVIALRPKAKEEEILQLNYTEKMDHDGGALLLRTPVINVIKKSGSYGFDPVLRAFKYDRLNIVIDGAMTATTACPNRMDPPTSQVAPNMIDHVQILKGPHAMRFGTAVGGTINYVSAGHSFSDKSDIYGRVSAGYENNGNILRSEGLIGFKGAKYDLRLFGSYSQGEDYTDGNGDNVQAGFLRGSVGADLGFLIAKNQEVSLQITRNFARDALFPALPMDLRSDDTWLVDAKHSITFDNKSLSSWSTTIYGSLVNHVMDNLGKDLDPRMANAVTDAETYTYGGRTEGKWNFNKSMLYAGADLRIEGAEGIRTREILVGPSAGKFFYDNAWQNSKITNTGLFGEYHIRANTFQFILSGRLVFNKAEALEPSSWFESNYESTESNQINPSISIGTIKNFQNNIAVGLWLGRAQRSGSLTERYINFFPVGQGPYLMVGNPELDPEVNNEVDVTFEYKADKMAINVDVFASYSQDYISASVDTILYNTSRFVNLGEVFRTGFEINWNQMLVAGLSHNFGIAYTYGQDLEIDQPLAEVAPLDLRYTLYGNYYNNKLKPEIGLRYVMEQNRISERFGETVTPSFFLVDFKIAYNISQTVSVSGGVRNLFDVAYYEHLNRSVRGAGDLPIYDPGTQGFISLSVNFL